MLATQKFSNGRVCSELARLELANLAAPNEFRAKERLSKEKMEAYLLAALSQVQTNILNSISSRYV